MLRRRRQATANLPASQEAQTPAGEEDLAATSRSASRVWRIVRDRGPAVFKSTGLEVSFDAAEDKALLTHREGLTRWITTGIHFGEGGVWYVESTQYRPGTEHEHQGAIIGRSTTYPLSQQERVFSSTTTYRQAGDGSLEPISVGAAEVGEPLSAAKAQALGKEMGEVANAAVLTRHLGLIAADVDVQA